MLGVGEKFPHFDLQATVGLDIKNAFKKISNTTYKNKWLVVFFWPKDFTFVCPTEIKAYDDLYNEFQDRDTQLIGGSTDSEFVHLAWRQHNKDLNQLKMPMIADVGGDLSRELGILDHNAKVAQRATFIVDPEGIIRHVSVNDLKVGRNPEETLRILDALQTDELCACNRDVGGETLKVA
ncbi:MAG: peroxiredoxin [Alphaproteobacteria bacterium]|jgi:alkyl hydroperoxide reductase subunit AhpC